MLTGDAGRRAELRSRIRRLNRLVIACFVVVGMALLYWGVLRAGTLAARADNPRQVTAELNIQRGPIVDRNGRPLAMTQAGATGLVRRYPLAGAGGPAVGHYSFRHGTAGVEDGADDVLRGERESFWSDLWRDTLHRPQIGHGVRLTLDADWQREAARLLEGHTGAAVVLSLPDAAIRVMASAPTYDPNRLDDQFDDLIADVSAPLLNRTAQGQYQPGLLLAPLLATWALDRDRVSLDLVLPEGGEPVLIDDAVVRCQVEVDAPATLGEALSAGCPAVAVALADRLSAADVAAARDAFRLTAIPAIPVAAEASAPQAVEDVQRAALGQADLLVSPLQVALAWSALAGAGELPQPRLIDAVADENGRWEPVAAPGAGHTAVGPEAARLVVERLASNGDNLEYAPLVLSGPGGRTNSWYLALAPAVAPRYVVVVVVEDTAERSAPVIGRALLNVILPE